MSPEKRNGPVPPRAARTSVTITNQTGTSYPRSATSIRRPADTRTLIPIITAVCYPPSGRRRRWLGIVEQCPACGMPHLHYGTPYGPPSGLRIAGCAHGVYKLHPIYGGAS